jgi:hypothetical protein
MLSKQSSHKALSSALTHLLHVVSTTLHHYNKKPQFARGFSFGGTGLLLKPLPPFVHEMTYQTVLENLGINSLSPKE